MMRRVAKVIRRVRCVSTTSTTPHPLNFLLLPFLSSPSSRNQFEYQQSSTLSQLTYEQLEPLRELISNPSKTSASMMLKKTKKSNKPTTMSGPSIGSQKNSTPTASNTSLISMPKQRLKVAAKLLRKCKLTVDTKGKVTGELRDFVQAVHECVKPDNHDAAALLLHSWPSKKIDFEIVLPGEKHSPLCHFLLHDAPKPIIQRLVELGESPHGLLQDGRSYLTLAVATDDIEVIKYLISLKVNVELGIVSPLYYAASRGIVPIIRLLLDKGAKINRRGADGRTPLWVAISNHQFHLVDLFIEEGADVNMRMNRSPGDSSPTMLVVAMTKLYVADEAGEASKVRAIKKVVKALVAAGADINPTWKGKLAFEDFYYNDEEIMRLLGR